MPLAILSLLPIPTANYNNNNNNNKNAILVDLAKDLGLVLISVSYNTGMELFQQLDRVSHSGGNTGDARLVRVLTGYSFLVSLVFVLNFLILVHT